MKDCDLSFHIVFLGKAYVVLTEMKSGRKVTRSVGFVGNVSEIVKISIARMWMLKKAKIRDVKHYIKSIEKVRT
jgi:hypothetical protein